MTAFEPETAPRSHLGQRFLNQIRERNHIELLPFDKTRWFRGAYSTIQRTLRDGFAPLSPIQKTVCANLLFCKIPVLGSGKFDEELRKLIEQVAGDFRVSIGHAQKLVSILCKYAVAIHFARPADLPCDWQNLV